jgi:hypothetical protein
MWWLNIFAGTPDIRVAVPAMVAGTPGPVAVLGWRLRDALDGPRRWRTDTDDDLRVGCTDGEKETADGGENLFLHKAFSLNCSLLGREFVTRVAQDLF